MEEEKKKKKRESAAGLTHSLFSFPFKKKQVLFAARIHPETRSGELSPGQVSRLSQALRSVAETACAARADSELFPREWIFHQR